MWAVGAIGERAFAIAPSQSLASIVRMALLEWLGDREQKKSKSESEDSQKSDKNDISTIDNA